MKIKLIVIFVAVLLAVASLFIHRPTVSVIMATWNRKDMAREAIESILNQTYRDFEFIIVDDASPDGTADMVQEYANKDKRIVFIRNTENKGLVYNLNLGLSLARGKYIARMDDDDIAYPERFEKQVAFLDEHPEITVLGTRISPIGTDNPYYFHRQVHPDLFEIELYLSSVNISHPTLLLRHDFLKKHNITYSEKYKYVEDRLLYATILKAGGRIMSLPEVLLHYRYYSSKKPDGYSYEQFYNVLNFHADFFSDFIRFSPDVLSKMSRCEKLRYMHDLNPQKDLVNQDILDNLLTAWCQHEDK